MAINMELTKQIRDILLRDWDPIGVGEVPEAQDEYDLYIGDIHLLLSRHADENEIAKYLSGVETERMGFSQPHNDKIFNATKKLYKLIVTA
jgi:hypothetical protein